MKDIICSKCNVPLEISKARFVYLERELHADVPKCPVCGQIYLSEQIVREKIAKVEKTVEDK